MGFDEALRMLEHGIEVTRSAWAGTGLVLGHSPKINGASELCFYMRTAKGAEIQTTLATVDILAKDWAVLKRK